MPQPIRLVDVEWRVVIPEDEPGQAWFVLTPKQYENLSRNYAEILRWVKEARGQLEYYRDE